MDIGPNILIFLKIVGVAAIIGGLYLIFRYREQIRNFLVEVWTELRKSSWPTRSELVDSTGVVLATVVLLGVFVASADLIFVQIIKWLTVGS